MNELTKTEKAVIHFALSFINNKFEVNDDIYSKSIAGYLNTMYGSNIDNVETLYEIVDSLLQKFNENQKGGLK